MRDDCQGWVCGGGFDGVVGVVSELSRYVNVVCGGFVDDFDCGDDVGVFCGAVLAGDGFEDGY